MNIRVAKTAGFCFGVNNAVKMAFDAAEKYKGKRIFTLGPLIHNDAVIERLEKSGVFVAESADQITKDDVVIIRAHGTTPETLEKLSTTGAVVLDATCPFVKKIHDRVKSEYEAGNQIIIIGDKDHPETVGTNGWCENKAIIIGSEEEAEKLVFEGKNVSCVVQTTFNGYIYEKIKKILKKTLDLIKFYDSICNATFCRQAEALEIASKSELMIVIGSKKSSNTLRLCEICKEVCPNVMLVSSPEDLDREKVNFLEVGVTAGASTPDFSIKEVLNIMDEVNSIVTTEEAQEMSFEDMVEATLKPVKNGDFVKGNVTKIEDGRVYVAFGFKYEGWIDAREFSRNADGELEVQVGEEVEASVVYVKDKDCDVKLSKKFIDQSKDLLAIEEAYINKTPVNVKLVKALEYAVIGQYGTVQIYIPAAQLSTRFIKDTAKFVEKADGKELTILITGFKKPENSKERLKISGSARILLEAEKNAKDEAFWGNIEIGKSYTGIVKSVTDYGAFVELAPGYEGLLHSTQISWKKIKNVKDVLMPGQEVEVSVVSFDKEAGKISLTAKRPEDDPWNQVAENYPVDSIVDVTVSKFAPYGVFVQITPELSALVHISQISTKHIESAKQCLSEGQQVQAKVLAIDNENKKLKLSIKAVQPYDPEPTPDELDENGNVIVKEEKPRRAPRKNADAQKSERKPRAPKKEQEEVFTDTHVSSAATIGDMISGLALDFSDEQ